MICRPSTKQVITNPYNFLNGFFSILDHCAAEESAEEDEEEVQCVDLEPVANIDELFDNENATKEFKV